jgi:hypothetical protein
MRYRRQLCKLGGGFSAPLGPAGAEKRRTGWFGGQRRPVVRRRD